MLAVAPSGRSLAVRCASGYIELWDVASTFMVQSLSTGWVQKAEFSKDGTTLATVGYDRLARVWDLPMGNITASFEHPTYVSALAFSSDARRLATADRDNTIRVWELERKACLVEMVHDEWVEALTFSPDGRFVATASPDGTARVWNIATGNELPQIHHGGEVIGIAFDATGTQLVTVAAGTVWGWRVQIVDLAGELCARLPRNFTPAEWNQFFPDELYRCTCENLPREE